MTAPASTHLTFCAQSDIGRVRKGNEDNFLALDLQSEQCWTGVESEMIPIQHLPLTEAGALFAVSDGMGGALAGEIASRMAVEIVSDVLPELQSHEKYSALPLPEQLRVALEQANTVIHRESVMNIERQGMGATFTAVAMVGDQAYFAQIGDSRAHVIRNGQITRITKDQSVVQQLVDMGEISEAEAETHPRRNYILQALGATSEIDVVVNSLPLYANDILLLCSDGLSGKVIAPEMLQLVNDSPDLAAAGQALIQLANERGGEDNITVLLVKITSEKLINAGDEEAVPEIIARSPDAPTEFLLEEIGLSPPATAPESATAFTPTYDTEPDLPALTPTSESFATPLETRQVPHGIDGKKFSIIFFSVIIAIALFVVYLNKSMVGNRGQLQQRLQQEQRTTITGLQTRITALRQRPNAAPELLSQLDILTKRLDEASAMDATKYPQVGQACSEVDAALAALERNP